MKLSQILSVRHFCQWPSYHLVFEWEDDLAACLAIPVLNIRPLLRRVVFNKVTQRLWQRCSPRVISALSDRLIQHGERSLVFVLIAEREISISTSRRCVPVIIDFWKDASFESFDEVYKQCELILISSLEVYERLKERGCALPIRHFALSLSDRYALEPKTCFEKKYDIVLAGRGNPVLKVFLDRFLEKFPTVEILEPRHINKEIFFVSNQTGMIGKFQSREEYMELLRASKVGFYSTPGIDGGETRTGGFNPVTPRFLELISAQCHILGRYPDNEETRFFEVSRVCPHVETYEQFEETLVRYLGTAKVPLETYAEILEQHYTSRRAEQLKEILGLL